MSLQQHFRSEDYEKDLKAESLGLLLKMMLNKTVILSVFSTKLRAEKLHGWKKVEELR